MVLVGGPGTGKTYLATAIGVQAVQHQYRRVRFFSIIELVNALELGKTAGKRRGKPEKYPQNNRSDLNLGWVKIQCKTRVRFTCKLIVDGVDVNLEQIKAGMAWRYKKYQKEQMAEDRRLYTLVEEQVRIGRVGLWGGTEQIPTWDWRKQEKTRK